MPSRTTATAKTVEKPRARRRSRSKADRVWAHEPEQAKGAKGAKGDGSGKENGSAVDRVTGEVRRAILNGTLSPGETFSITELSEKLGVSHIPVREALRRLDAVGLIVLRPGRSAMVRALDIDELRSIYRLRRTLEPGIAARSAHLYSRDDLARMDALLAAYGTAGNDSESMWQAHHDLHLALLAPAASAWDLRVLNQLWMASDRYTRIVFETYRVDPLEQKRRSEAHLALLRAARSGSPSEVRSALDEHLTENEAACLTRLGAFHR